MARTGRKTKSLTLHDFKGDYQHFVKAHPVIAKRVAELRKLVQKHYAHIQADCVGWLHRECNLHIGL